MKKDVENKVINELNRRLRKMPDIIADFIFSNQEDKELSTQLSYVKDITVFLEFILDLPEFTHINKISDFTVDDLKPPKLTEKDIRFFLSYLTEYKKTFNRKDGSCYTQTFRNQKVGKARKLATLHTLYEWLSRQKDLDVPDITRYIEIKINKKRQIKDKLTHEEIDRLINTILDDVNIETQRAEKFHKRLKLRDLTIFLILAYTGIRISELVQLDINDVSIKDTSMIVIRKGGDQDKVFMPKEILNTLSAFIQRRKELEGVSTEYENALFISGQLRRIAPRTVRYMLDKYRKRAKISMKITPHTLRRSFGTELLNQLGDIQLVADTLGHKSPETTRNHYAETSEQRKRKAITDFNYHNANKEDQENIDKNLSELAKITGITVEQLKENLGLTNKIS